MADTRFYTSRRSAIVSSLVEALKEINGTGDYLTDVHDNVFPNLLFWDEVNDFPAIHVVAGSETREYQGDCYKDRFLNLSIWAYVEQPDTALEELDGLLEDIETVIENNSRLAYTDKQGNPQFTHQMTLLEITTDEGALNTQGLAVGQLTVEVRY